MLNPIFLSPEATFLIVRIATLLLAISIWWIVTAPKVA